MKIAILSPCFEYVPPRGYGGTELVVYNLIEGLVKKGYDVTLFSSEGSKTSAKVVTNGLPPTFHDKSQDPVESQKLLDNKLVELQDNFDIVHSHTSYRFLYLEDKIIIPHVLTVHTMFRDKWKKLYLEHPMMPIVSISNSQAKLSGLKINFIGTVYNGIDLKGFTFSPRRGHYLAWIGRIVRQKGLLEAIKIAEKLKMKIKAAGRFVYDCDDDKKYAEEVKEVLKRPHVEYIGEVEDKKKNELLKGASILLNPILWPEPFGLVVPEANACGTPTVAYAMGAMPELIIDGVNGYLVESNNEEKFVEAVEKINNLDDQQYTELRNNSRKHVEENFTVEKMVEGYENIYKKILKGK